MIQKTVINNKKLNPLEAIILISSPSSDELKKSGIFINFIEKKNKINIRKYCSGLLSKFLNFKVSASLWSLPNNLKRILIRIDLTGIIIK
tara:strand:- start:311 stop:580 length:270 start_codon:yes stop_codon:yes gene_type:complete